MELKLKELRESKGITQTFVARKLGYKYPSSYSLIEKGERKLDIITAKKLADIYEVSLDDFFRR